MPRSSDPPAPPRVTALILLGLLLIGATRLTFLVGPNLLLDGDEAVVGLMARHLVQAGEIPLFFWGQAYGFCLLEAGSGGLMFMLFGESDLSLRLGMLSIWSLGWVFALLTLREMRGHPALALLLVCCPAWSFWAMAARGGYVTAFMLTQLCFWLTARTWRLPPAAPTPTRLLVMLGLCQGLLFHAQALWLLVLIPFDLRLLLRGRWLQRCLIFGGAWLLVALPLKLLAPAGEAVTYHPQLFGTFDPVARLLALPGDLLAAMTGSYYLSKGVAASPAGTAAASIWCLVLLTCLGHAAVSLIRRQRAELARTCSLSILLLCGVSLVVDPAMSHPRYLLPLAGILALYLGDQLSRLLRRRPWPAILLATLIGGGGAAGIVDLGQRSRLAAEGLDTTAIRDGIAEVVRVLEGEGIQHLYCCQTLVQWQVMFYSQERIVTRSLARRDRYPAHHRAVDAARRSGARYAVLGWFTDTSLLAKINETAVDKQRLVLCGKQLFLILDPRPELLSWMRFQLD